MTSTESISEECAAARTHCVLYVHPNRGVIEVRGEDRISFLHNVLSNDIKSLAPGKGVPACLLNAQAKIIAHMNVLCFDGFHWLALDYSARGALFQALNKLIITEQVELLDRSDELKLISIHGPKSSKLVDHLTNESAPEEFLSHKTITISSVAVSIIRINLIGEIGFGFLTAKEEAPTVIKAIRQSGNNFGLKEIQASTLETLRIEAGIPRYGVDFDESNIPLEAGLEKAVSFTKGCFPGQEILARLDSRGGVAKKLCGLVLESETLAKKNDRIVKDGNEAGLITSAVFSPALKKNIALGFLRKECWAPATSVVIQTEVGSVPARVKALPFLE